MHNKNLPASDAGQYTLVTNTGGQTLGYSPKSGVKILVVDGFAFKDLNKNGKLDKYEDWRLSADERARDLAAQMTIEQIAGLMLYSRHQPIPLRRVVLLRAPITENHMQKAVRILSIFPTSRPHFLQKIM